MELRYLFPIKPKSIRDINLHFKAVFGQHVKILIQKLHQYKTLGKAHLQVCQRTSLFFVSFLELSA